MPARRILLLGGTGEARQLADALIAAGHHVISSLAGVTPAPILPAGEVRRGGFGGVAGLVEFLRDHHIDMIADATHPFAVQMSRHACAAARETGLLYLRLERPRWTSEPGDRWKTATDIAEAVALLPAGARVFAAIGRKEIGLLAARADLSGVARMIGEPAAPLPDRWRLLLARPPFSIEAERALLAQEGITHLLTRNSGAADARAKLVAARECGVAVVMIARPVKPEAPVFAEVEELVRAVG